MRNEKQTRKHCVYLITNLVNGKQYVGQTRRSIKGRWSQHKSEARLGSSLYLYRALRKYGPTSFKVSILRCGLTQEEANMEESLAVKHLFLTDRDFGYNMTEGGLGGKPLAEVRKRIGEFRRKILPLQEIQKLYKSGQSARQISMLYGVSETTITRRLKKSGFQIRSSQEGLNVLHKINMSNTEVADLYQGGWNSYQIAEKFDVSPTTVISRLKKCGISIRDISVCHRKEFCRNLKERK